ncbi:MAG TPA: efflux RND transporter periplasmic adaptor subunit [Lentimicrobium sp.]|jgi:HlyD family secretion protein|nr:efflux RND transporter periplasmic adaptor subunit [Lentimicrobium sp.]
MKRRLLNLCICILATVAISCNRNNRTSDAYGNFEAVETTVSAEASGKILWLVAVEGQVVAAGDTAGLIDTTDLHLRVRQLMAQRSALQAKAAGITAQAGVHRQQKENLSKDKTRIENLLMEEAATPKQLDDITGAIAVADRQIDAVKAQLLSLEGEIGVVDAQLAQVRESLKRCYIIHPVSGTVLNRFAEAGEISAYGKPLFRVADMETMDLRVYISGDMLSAVKTGDEAEVLIDTPEGLKKLGGTVTWISPTAEFTPRIIQTREERVTLVYAVKLNVKNDGSLKISMPAEVNFNK